MKKTKRIEHTKRNDNIILMRADGYAFRAIGEKYKITAQRVRFICIARQKRVEKLENQPVDN